MHDFHWGRWSAETDRRIGALESKWAAWEQLQDHIRRLAFKWMRRGLIIICVYILAAVAIAFPDNPIGHYALILKGALMQL